MSIAVSSFIFLSGAVVKSWGILVLLLSAFFVKTLGVKSKELSDCCIACAEWTLSVNLISLWAVLSSTGWVKIL
jgi:hypothetical protein